MKNENNYLTHGIHPYHAKFIPSIPKDFLLNYSNENDLVLDPFCGSGTTLLECLLNNRKSIGVDLNEIACKISKAKVFIPNIEILDKYYNDILCFDIESDFEKIQFDNKSIWYTKDVSLIIDCLLFEIKKIENDNYRNIFEVIISSIVKTVSNKRKTWNNGYIADNVLPNVEYKGDVLRVFKRKYSEIKKSYSELIVFLNKKNYFSPKVYCKNILDYNSDRKFDLIITSPPYPFAVDFAKYNRLSYYWLGFDVDKACNEETGARNKRSKKNSEKEFFNEMEKIYLHLFNLVKTNGYFCMTVADTQRDKKKVSFIDWLYDIFLNNGWKLEIDEIRKLNNQSMAQKRITHEHKLVFKKTV